MIQKIYSIRDSKGNMFNQPFMELTHGAAERTFHRLTNDSKSNINSYPEDFDLYYLGDFDTEKGTYKTPDTPQHVVKAVQVIDKTHGSGAQRHEPIHAVQQ